MAPPLSAFFSAASRTSFLVTSILVGLLQLGLGAATQAQEDADKIRKALQQENFEKARHLAEKALGKEAGPSAYCLAAKAYFSSYQKKRGDSASASEAYRKTARQHLIAAAEKASENSLACKNLGQRMARTYYQDGTTTFQAEDFFSAQRFMENYMALQKALGQNPKSLAYFFAGHASFATEQPAIALEYLEKAMESQLKEPLLYVDLAHLYFQQGDTGHGLSVINTGQQLFPRNKTVNIHRLGLHTKAGRLDTLSGELESLTKVFRNDLEVYLRVAEAHRRLMLSKDLNKLERSEHYYQAKELYNAALEINPNSYEANYKMGLTLYNRAALLIAESSYDVDLMMLNKILDESTALFKEAVPYVEKARELMPEDQGVLTTLQGLYYNLSEDSKFREVSESVDTFQPPQKR